MATTKSPADIERQKQVAAARAGIAARQKTQALPTAVAPPGVYAPGDNLDVNGDPIATPQALSPQAQAAKDWNASHVFARPGGSGVPAGQAFVQVGPDVSDAAYSSAIQRQGKTPLQISQEADAATYAMARQAGINSYARGQLTSDMEQTEVERLFPKADVQMKPEGWVFGGPGGSVQQNAVPSTVSSAPVALSRTPIVATLPSVRTPFNRNAWQGGALPGVPTGMRMDNSAAPVVRDFRGNPLPESMNWTKNAPVQVIPQVTPWPQKTPGVNYGIKKSPGYDFSGTPVTPRSTPLAPIQYAPSPGWWEGLKQSWSPRKKQSKKK